MKRVICLCILLTLVVVMLTGCSKLSDNLTSSSCVESLSLTPSELQLKTGDSKAVTVTCASGNVDSGNVTWSSSNQSVADVENGTVTAVATGNAVITAKYNNLSATCNVTVTDTQITSITLDAYSASVYVGDTKQITAVIAPKDATDTQLTWSTSDSSIAIVNSTGLVTGVKSGYANITCSDSYGHKETCTIKVVAKSQSKTTTKSSSNTDDNTSDSNSCLDDNIDTLDIKTPFYGIWCGAYLTPSDTESDMNKLISHGFRPYVFVTTDWSNLNPKKYYVVTAGVYSYEEAAKDELSSVQSLFSDAYVKFSGNYIG